jgi:hypothetical protein
MARLGICEGPPANDAIASSPATVIGHAELRHGAFENIFVTEGLGARQKPR